MPSRPVASAPRRVSVAPRVAEALASGRPVVALESTLIAHGLPWPENLETALGSEAAVREAGAEPATIAVIDGAVRVGLEPGQVERLARPGAFLKAGRRDLGYALAMRKDAATTVSATLWAARTAGIGIMATGGLGGVHREAGSTFDVSADLDELARADGVTLVCSGVKTILDVPATLEALETRGVLVVGYRTSEFPGFTATTTGIPLEHRVDSPEEAARVVAAHRALGIPGAVVLAQPVDPAVGLDPVALEEAIAGALAEARRAGISGKAVTPFLLDRVRISTSGMSLKANVMLILANAQLAAHVAIALSIPNGH